jgi:hypothetical protein
MENFILNVKNRIIVLVDLSQDSKQLIQFAEKLCIETKGRIIMIHRLIGVAPALTDEDSRKIIFEAERHKALIMLESLADKFLSTKPTLIATNESILKVLNDLKNKIYTDWVLVGLKGTSFFKQLFVGSISLNVIDESQHLTFGIPLKNMDINLSELVVAVSPKYPVKIDYLHLILANLRNSIKKVSFISIISNEEESLETHLLLDSLTHEFSGFSSSFSTFQGDNAKREIENYMDKKETCFLVIQQGSRGIKDLFFRKFFTDDLVYNGSTPLIILPQ